MANLDVNAGQSSKTQGPPEDVAKSNASKGKGEIDPSRVRQLIDNLTTTQATSSPEAVKITKKEGAVEHTDDLAQGILHFANAAKEKGMTREEIDHHIQFIATNLFKWTKEAKSEIKAKGLKHSIEFIAETGTVVTHFKGTCLGVGAFGKVKESIVSASLAIPIGTTIARKEAKGKKGKDGESTITQKKFLALQIVREGKITQEFNDSQNVRGCHRVNEEGILLEGMAQTLAGKLQTSPSRSFDENLQIAKQLGNGLCEIHAKGYAHNDLKADNCFVSSEGKVKIGDLGSAEKLGEINRRPINLNIASPNQLVGQLFNANTVTSKEDDVFAMGQVFYLLENGRAPDFVDGTKQFLGKIQERNALIQEISALSTHEQKQIYSWNGSDTLPPSVKEKAESYFAIKVELRSLYQNHINGIKTFLDEYNPQTPLGQLAKQMMNLNSDKRISSENMLIALQNMASATFSLPDSVEESPQDISEDPNYTDAVPVETSKPPAPNYTTAIPVQTSEPEAANYSNSIPVETSRPNYTDQYAVGLQHGAPTHEEKVVPDSELLLKALFKETPDQLNTLLKRGVDVCGWRDANGQTLLHLAAEGGKMEIVNFLCDHGADVNAKDFDGKPPIYYAAKFANVQAGRILIAHGADLEVGAGSGKPLLAYDEEDMGIYYLENDQYKESGIRFLDDNKLLIGVAKEKIDPVFNAWYQNQAITLEFMSATSGVSDEAKQKLALLSLQAFDKAASHGINNSKKLRFQMSPLFPSENRYHRSTGSEMMNLAQKAYTNKFWTLHGHMRLVHSPLVSEVIARSCPKDGKVISVSGPEDLQELAAELRENNLRDEKNPLIIDYSSFVAQKGGGSDAAKLFEDTVWKDFITQNPDLKLKPSLNENWEGTISLCVLQEKGQNLLLVSGDTSFMIDDTLRHTGFVLSPDEVKEAFLKLKTPEEVLRSANLSIPVATLATPGAKIPTLFSSINGLYATNAFKQFAAMGNIAGATPYQKALSEGTAKVLEGLSKHPANQNAGKNGIEEVFKKHGLEGFLQISYSKIQIGLANATFKKGDLVQFLNAIEQVHQEVQNILAILSLEGGYGESDFGDMVAKRLTEGPDPVVPKELGLPRAQLKPSAMHGLSSTLASVEAMKGTNQLNVALLHDTYYEESALLSDSKNYSVSILDGDNFKKDPATVGFSEPPQQPIDLFVCEFHHNISLTRQKYSPEDVLGQILAMHKNKMLAEPCTVLIDTTIDLEKSDQMRALLHNPEIKKMIQEGKLNIVFLKSAQKFDMLGLDNYYGGVTTTINNGKDFARFNERMERKEDQQAGLSYQGMAHLQLHAADSVDKYRLGIMENCNKLYKALPKKLIFEEGSANPVQVSRIEDNRLVFLDIKSPGNKIADHVFIALKKYVKKEGLALTSRSSFGFPTTNLTLIPSDDGNRIRINPGLEGEKDIARYAQFFKQLQDVIDGVMQNSEGKSPKELEEIVIRAIQQMAA